MKEQKEYNVLKKYAVIESYPAQIKHDIPLIAIVLFLIYVIFFIWSLIKYLFQSIRGKYNFFKVFMKTKKPKIIEGATTSHSYDFEKIFKILSLFENNSNIKSTEMVFYYNKEAKVLMKKLFDQGLCSLESVTSLGNFTIREETIHLKNSVTLDKNIFLTRELTEPAYRTLKVKNCVSNSIVSLIEKMKLKLQRKI